MKGVRYVYKVPDFWGNPSTMHYCLQCAEAVGQGEYTGAIACECPCDCCGETVLLPFYAWAKANEVSV